MQSTEQTDKVPLSFDCADVAPHQLSENGERLLRESIADFENGNYTTYENLEDLNKAMAQMLYIPPTSPDCYISSIVALNIISPEATGDWHSAFALSDNGHPLELYLYGKNQPRNTNHLLGRMGIIDGTQRLNDMGYYPEHTPVWLADHPRACVDYLYYAVLKTGQIGRVMLDEWFPSDEDKASVYALIHVLEPKLTDSERANLQLWKQKNPRI